MLETTTVVQFWWVLGYAYVISIKIRNRKLYKQHLLLPPSTNPSETCVEYLHPKQTYAENIS